MDQIKSLRQHLVKLLQGTGEAHADFDAAVKDMPSALQGKIPQGAEHSPWQELEHLRIAQWDILEFSRNPKHVSPTWPDDYWPKTVAPPSAAAWNKSVREVRANLKAMEQLVQSKQSDLSRRIPHGEGQTLLREALLLADHNAYHVGQLVLLRRLLGAWSPR